MDWEVISGVWDNVAVERIDGVGDDDAGLFFIGVTGLTLLPEFGVERLVWTDGELDFCLGA